MQELKAYENQTLAFKSIKWRMACSVLQLIVISATQKLNKIIRLHMTSSTSATGLLTDAKYAKARLELHLLPQFGIIIFYMWSNAPKYRKELQYLAVSRSQTSHGNCEQFSLCDLPLSFPIELKTPIQERGVQVPESCTACHYSMVYCLSLFCHITGIMSAVSEYVHGNWLLQ